MPDVFILVWNAMTAIPATFTVLFVAAMPALGLLRRGYPSNGERTPMPGFRMTCV